MRLFLLLLFTRVVPQLGAMAAGSDTLHHPQESHLRNIRQLTFGGENAEAYFSFDGKRLIFQSTRDSFACDQIYSMNIDGTGIQHLSTGTGRTTCSYPLPGDTGFIYSTTQFDNDSCPPRPDYSKGYVWAVYPGYDIVTSSLPGGTPRLLTRTDGYDAEATVSPLGDRIVFTSIRNGDLDIYSMNLDGSDVRQLTTEIGYDGGAFYSWDGTKIIYRAYHPENDSDKHVYLDLIRNGFVRPSAMELYIMNSNGSEKRQITSFGGANFAPFFHPDGQHIIFSSNMNDPKGRNFDLYMIALDGSGLERITFNETFDGFPVFSREGKQLVFASNRNAKARGETNIFIADWVP